MGLSFVPPKNERITGAEHLRGKGNMNAGQISNYKNPSGGVVTAGVSGMKRG